jgi:light-regulated signal transduction histidine kinase (bacteriophytochrome)
MDKPAPSQAAASAAQTIATLLKRRDGEDRTSAEQEILRITANLEAQLHERTEEVLAANHSLEDFSYSVSHDLRAPLSTIDGFSRLLEGAIASASPDKAQHYLQRVRLGVVHLNDLLGAVLAVSRLARAEMHLQPVDLGALAQEAFAALQERDPQRGANVVVARLPPASGDPALLKQLVDQLADNAWKFSAKKEHAEIQVGVESGADGETVYFFRDNGAGFDMAQMDKLFGMFQRLHPASEFPGNGAGLCIVQRIAQRHGGRAWIKGAPDQGATVYFTLAKKAAAA